MSELKLFEAFDSEERLVFYIAAKSLESALELIMVVNKDLRLKVSRVRLSDHKFIS